MIGMKEQPNQPSPQLTISRRVRQVTPDAGRPAALPVTWSSDPAIGTATTSIPSLSRDRAQWSRSTS